MSPVFVCVVAALLLAAGAAADDLSVPLQVFEARRLRSEGADRKAEGVCIGVPFPEEFGLGEVDGRPALGMKGVDEYQFRTLARWSNGSVRSAAVVFQTDCKAKKAVSGLTVVAGRGISGGKKLATETDAAIVVDTGALKATVKKKGFALFDSVTVGGVEILKAGGMDAPVLAGEATYLGSADGTAVLEENGPVRCVVKAVGSNRDKDGKRMLGYIVRMYFYRGRDDVKVYYTCTNDENKENKNKVYVKDISLVSLLAATPAAVTVTGHRDALVPGADTPVMFYQARPGMDVKRGSGKEGMGWDKFGVKGDDTGFRVTHGDREVLRGDAKKSPDLMWMDVADGNGAGVTVGVRFARGNFPKTLRAKGDRLEIGLWPAESGVKHVIAHGSHMTFEILYDFHAKKAEDPDGAMYRFQYPLTGRATVEWYNRCARDGDVYPFYHFVSRAEEEKLCSEKGWKTRQARRARRMTVWRSWYWGRGGFRNQHDFARVSFVNFLRDDNVERAGAYFLYAEDRFNYNVDWSIHHGEGKSDFGRKRYIGRKINFEEEHRHWYGIPIFYYCTGDQRIGDAVLEYVRKFRADCASRRMYGWSRFLGWGVYLLAGGYDMTREESFRDGLRGHLKTVLSGKKWPMDWHRGAFGHGGKLWHEIPPEPAITVKPGLMMGYIIHDSFWNARRQFAWDDPVGERYGDICEGIQWLMGRECFIEDEKGLYCPYIYNVAGYPRGHKRGWGFIGEAHFSVVLPLLENGEEYGPNLAERVLDASFACGLNEDGFTYLDHPGCQALLYYYIHQGKGRAGEPPAAVEDLKVEALGGGKVKLSWTSPGGAAKFQARYSPRKMVPNLNWDRDKRKYEFHPDEHSNWWAAEHLQGEPAGKPGEKQSFEASGLKPGTYQFAMRCWDAKNRRSAISNQVSAAVK